MPSAPLWPRNVHGDRIVVAAIVTTIAFAVYAQTLLPDVDLGDTGAFQAAVLWPETSARQAYPLYFGLAAPFVRLLSTDNPARGLNLFSAVGAAAAVGLLTWVVAAVTRSLAGGVAGGLLLAFSYTFWTQAVIAEVYALHLALVGVSLVALNAFAAKPTRARLAMFCAVYALAFGNHLSMILLFVPSAAFVLMVHPRPRELFRPGVIGMSMLIAVAGALQYWPNFTAIWSSIDAPEPGIERLAGFWFDVTKADWRESMVLGINVTDAGNRLAMWSWDAYQQFGWVGLILAILGSIRLWWISRAWAAFVGLAYAINTIFTVTYNVGDSHVFFLPGHFFAAFAAGAALALPARAERRNVPADRLTQTGIRVVLQGFAAVVIVYAVWRAWDTWPAADRHRDYRGAQLASRATYGLTEQNALLVSQMNWDQENALLYSARYSHPEVAWVRLFEVLPHFPYLVRDNLGIGREVVLTADAAADVVAAYDGLFPLLQDDLPAAPPLSVTAAGIPRGSPYFLTILAPLRAYRYDEAEVERALEILAGERMPARQSAAYEVVAGIAGEAPALYRTSQTPFRDRISLLGDQFTVRMDAWLPSDTFRRGGFGHVVRGHERVLFVERGVSLVWFSAGDSPVVAYAAGPYAPRPRFRIPLERTRLAAR
jgi:Protein of unknown function (DUF2723)